MSPSLHILLSFPSLPLPFPINFPLPFPPSPSPCRPILPAACPDLHTCQQAVAIGNGQGRMGYSKLFRVNSALYYDQLLLGAAGWDDSVLDTVPLLVDERPDSGGMPCMTERFYLVRRGDTCVKLIASRYKRKVDLFRSLNGGFDCTVSSLWVGMQLCLP
ncbi:unnamed protein product [Closterium sp. NIES-65]|nr:unnamed protein product [Closterium sp. NIES-65]